MLCVFCTYRREKSQIAICDTVFLNLCGQKVANGVLVVLKISHSKERR